VEHLLCEPVELTEVELDEVSGGFSISVGVGASGGSTVGVGFKFIIKSEPTTVIWNGVDNSVSVSFG